MNILFWGFVNGQDGIGRTCNIIIRIYIVVRTVYYLVLLIILIVHVMLSRHLIQ